MIGVTGRIRPNTVDIILGLDKWCFFFFCGGVSSDEIVSAKYFLLLHSLQAGYVSSLLPSPSLSVCYFACSSVSASYLYILRFRCMESPRCVVANVLDYDIVINDFELSRTITITLGLISLEKAGTPLSLSYGSNSNTSILLQGEWLWRWIANEGWYVIKQRNQSNYFPVVP